MDHAENRNEKLVERINGCRQFAAATTDKALAKFLLDLAVELETKLQISEVTPRTRILGWRENRRPIPGA